MAKRIKVSRKHLLKDPDQFLSTSEKAMLYYIDNRATVIGVVATLLIVVSSFFGFKYYTIACCINRRSLWCCEIHSRVKFCRLINRVNPHSISRC